MAARIERAIKHCCFALTGNFHTENQAPFNDLSESLANRRETEIPLVWKLPSSVEASQSAFVTSETLAKRLLKSPSVTLADIRGARDIRTWAPTVQ